MLSVTGYWQENPAHVFGVLVAPGAWDGHENDNNVFYYMDGDALSAGDVIADGFCVLTVAREGV